MTFKVGDRQHMVYQETDNGPVFMMDDEEYCLTIFSLQFWRVSSAIICYFYRFSYFYMPLYQFYAFSRASLYESKPFLMDKGVHLRDEYKYGRRSGVGANVKYSRGGWG